MQPSCIPFMPGTTHSHFMQPSRSVCGLQETDSIVVFLCEKYKSYVALNTDGKATKIGPPDTF